jgi:hypothetical protein
MEVSYPDIAIVHDGHGVLHRLVIPHFGETVPVDLSGIEGFLLFRGPAYDSAAIAKALSAIFGGSS